jgi:hypothetical protein
MRHRGFLAGLAVCAFGASAAPAVAGGPYHQGHSGDQAVASHDRNQFRLNSRTLEPGCFDATSSHRWHDRAMFGHGGWIKFQWDVDTDDHVDVTQDWEEAHVTVEDDAPFSIDQVLVPGKHDGYRIYNTFDTGSINNDADIDPNQTATDLMAPLNGQGDPDYVDERDIIVCVSDHPDGDQNEPYEPADDGEVAATNRPIIQPIVSALGVSAVEPLNTYKVGFGYEVEQWYDFDWYAAFNTDKADGFWWGDPQAFFTTTKWNEGFSHVIIKDRPEQDGVRRYNDIDEFGEEFNDPHSEKSSYGQPTVFHRDGDQYAYLHKSLPGAIDGGYYGDTFLEGNADQTEESGLLTFTAQGDLPISWALKASLAPERYGRKATLTDDQLRAWEASWQAYYKGTGAKPTLPLAPGTNSPTPDPGVIVNLPQTSVVVNVPAAGGGTTPVVQQQEVKGAVTAVSSRVVTIRLSKAIAKSGRVFYWSAKGPKLAKARKVGGRLVAKVDLRGLPKGSGTWGMQVSGKSKSGKKVVYLRYVRL